nr:MAG TPA: hypothetical protein [Caudoviricetes sp.]
MNYVFRNVPESGSLNHYRACPETIRTVRRCHWRRNDAGQ